MYGEDQSGSSSSTAPGASHLTKDEYAYVVERTHLVAVDLLLFDEEGRILLGRRKNAPARGAWFTPGGRVRKNEPFDVALERVAADEVRPFSRRACPGLSARTMRADPCLHGAYRHLYEDSFAGEPYGTDYVNFAYRARAVEVYDGIDPKELERVSDADEQHSELRWFSIGEVMRDDSGVHPYVQCYFHADAWNRIT